MVEHSRVKGAVMVVEVPKGTVGSDTSGVSKSAYEVGLLEIPYGVKPRNPAGTSTPAVEAPVAGAKLKVIELILIKRKISDNDCRLTSLPKMPLAEVEILPKLVLNDAVEIGVML